MRGLLIGVCFVVACDLVQPYDDRHLYDNENILHEDRLFDENEEIDILEDLTDFVLISEHLQNIDDEVDRQEQLSDSIAESKKKYRINVRMPKTTITEDDTYLCTSVKLTDYNPTNSLYIVEYIPHAIQSVAHHMLLYGCTEPGSNIHAVWDCSGEMDGKGKTEFATAPTCAVGETILWAWAKDAPLFVLPQGVGFQVGKNTNIKYLTLQAHFKSKLAANKYGIDKISVTAVATIEPQPKLAGIYVLASSEGSVKPHSKQNMDIVCKYNGKIPMYPFAFRTHTHALGKMVYGYRVRNHVWTLIGKKNPQKPEAFYRVHHPVKVEHGDWLAARCVMESERNHTTSIGATHNDEMCNFYFMYWTARSHAAGGLGETSCENGYPHVHWSTYFYHPPHTL